MPSISRGLAPVLALLAALAFACGGGDDETPEPTATATEVALAPAGPATFGIIAGAAEDAFDIEQFMPATVRIREGDSITWRGQGYEGHTVTFFPDGRLNIGRADYLIPAPDQPDALEFNPVFALSSDAQGSYDGSVYTNSGFFGVPAEGEYSLAFPKAGVYPYLCMVHPLGMRGTIVVEPAATDVPAPDAVKAEGERLLRSYVEESRAAARAGANERADANERASNGEAWQVSAGIDTPRGQVLSFLPGALEIEAGDRVVFWNSERDFHNVVFVPEGADAPPFPILKPVEGRRGFRLLINPEAEHELPPPADFGPEALFSSGLLGIGFPRFYYDVTFSKPGTYHFYCTVHVLAGMAGSITVR